MTDQATSLATPHTDPLPVILQDLGVILGFTAGFGVIFGVVSIIFVIFVIFVAFEVRSNNFFCFGVGFGGFRGQFSLYTRAI